MRFVIIVTWMERINCATGYKWADIEACVHWMAPFSAILRQYGSAELKQFSNIKSSYVHNIQTHSVDMKLLVCFCV
jgi:hypothetical protein